MHAYIHYIALHHNTLTYIAVHYDTLQYIRTFVHKYLVICSHVPHTCAHRDIHAFPSMYIYMNK